MNEKETEEKKVKKTTKKTGTIESKAKKSMVTKKTKTKSTNTIKKSSSTKVAKSTKDSATAKRVTKKAVNKKDTKAQSTTKKVSKAKKADLISIIEYYDLPYRYNQTIVKILAQTPNMLFVYWDISDNDREIFTTNFGENFFSKTRPVLIVHNETMNYSFELEINDFANCWYIHVNDANCKYEIELGRRPVAYTNIIKEDYIYISSSNKLDSPNNHILFENFNPNITYKNVKTGNISNKKFNKLSNYKNMQEIYNIYDLYRKIYNDDLFNDVTEGNFVNSSSSPSF